MVPVFGILHNFSFSSRLERLLTRKKFEAAESLAKVFGLDMSLIHIARAQCILDEMQPWNQKVKHTSGDNNQLLNSLISELDNIPVSKRN